MRALAHRYSGAFGLSWFMHAGIPDAQMRRIAMGMNAEYVARMKALKKASANSGM